VNALQDMVVENDGTVRNSDKNIIQFRFGDDGIDPMHTDHGSAVNLDVLLLKAKALDVKKIREEVKEATIVEKSSPKVKKVSKTKPKKITTPKEKPTKEAKSKIEEKTIDENELLKQFEAETGKKAIWRGKETKGYLDWKKEKLG
jgi:hypothetical protein